VIALDDAGYRLLATNHDSILVEVQLEDVDEASTKIARIMSETGAELLGGHRLRVDTHVVRPGQSLLPSDPTSRRFWKVFEQMRQSLGDGDAVFGIGGQLYQQSEFCD
jgi:hypothetical protein